ncbi:MAG: hypothetical protein JWR33_2451 [Naasia sp.]|jgi:hypothetical protein|uniref:CYTH domain-containing protein n=1 Tax=Naasia sp. TaxID=2546198 RepID=UPI002629C05A|nr:CYTH domain-containing protein [Naasia sp.]MCU1571710.1 hypothetical protein [Naasia sp.]
MDDPVTASTETERKYDVPEDAPIPELGALAAAVRQDRFTLRATYFDTPDGALGRSRMTLRRREGGHDAGWHLKTPGDDGRTEHHAPLADTLPSALHALVAELLGGQDLREVAQLVTERATTILLDDAGAGLAEIADDRVTATDLNTGTVRSWREWEAELMDAAPSDRQARAALLDSIEAELLAAGAVPSGSESKLARALGRSSLQ